MSTWTSPVSWRSRTSTMGEGSRALGGALIVVVVVVVVFVSGAGSVLHPTRFKTDLFEKFSLGFLKVFHSQN